MVLLQIIMCTLCILNVFVEFITSKEINEKVLLWLILSFVVAN